MRNSYNKKYHKVTPEGTKDLLFEEYTARLLIQKKLEKVFKLRGFNRVMTPSIEYLDLFSMGSATVNTESMYKFTDLNGRLLALRADATLPIARVVATRLQNTTDPKRLYYIHKIYRNNPGFMGKKNEVMQAGIEVIGATGVKTDLELIVTACETLKACKNNFRIEISYAGLFKSLIKELNASDEVKEQIRYLTETKNYASLNTVLDDMKETETVNAIRQLPRLFGGEEVFGKAYKLTENVNFRNQLDYLEHLYKILKDSGYADNLIIDLGLVNRNDYYSGIVFSGYVTGIAESVLVGGRYDRLISNFGLSKPAIGFGVDIDALSELALENGEVTFEENNNVLIHCDNGFEDKLIECAEKLHGEGISCEYSVFLTVDEAIEYAKEKHFKWVYYVKDNVEKIKITTGE